MLRRKRFGQGVGDLQWFRLAPRNLAVIRLRNGRYFLARFPALRERRFFLFLSRIHRKKGCDLLLEAFARVAADTDLDLVMAARMRTVCGSSWRRRRSGWDSGRVHWTGCWRGM